MNRKTIFAVCFAALTLSGALCFGQGPVAAPEPAAAPSGFLERIAGDTVFVDMPKDLCIMRLAVMPIKGDSSSAVVNAVVASLKRRGCPVVDRDNLPTILKEQNIPVDLVDETSAVKAVLYGSVDQYLHLPGAYSLKASLRIADTQTTEILWTKNIAVREISKGFKIAGLIAAIIVLLIIIFVYEKWMGRKDVVDGLNESKKIRNDILQEIRKCRDNSMEVQNSMTKHDNTELASLAKDLSLRLSDLQQTVENSPYGVGAKMNPANAAGANKTSKTILKGLADLADIISKLRDKTANNGTMFLAGRLRDSIACVQDLKNKHADLAKFFRPV